MTTCPILPTFELFFGRWLGRSSIAALAICISQTTVSADVPLPERIHRPASVAEAWNVIGLATANVKRLINEKRLDEVASQIALCSAPLRLLAAGGAGLEDQKLIDETAAKAFNLVNLTAKESMADNQVGAENVFGILQSLLSNFAKSFDPALVNAEVYACLAHPEVVSLQSNTTCDICSGRLRARRIPYSFIYVRPKLPVLSVKATFPLQSNEGQSGSLKLKITHLDGSFVNPDDLILTHGAPVHLMLVDEAFERFQHLNPVPGEVPGEYEVSFAGVSGQDMRAWVGVVPVETGLQEYHRLEFGAGGTGLGSQKPAPPLLEVMTTEVDAVQFQLSLPGLPKIKAGQTRLMRLDLADATGKPMDRLQPIRGAFAHLTGVYQDDETLFEIHPVGGELAGEDLRGGPGLAFKFHPPKAGYLRLFCQIQVDGKRITAGLGLHVVE